MVGKKVIIKGEIHSQEDLTIEGQVQGKVDIGDHRLTIGPNASLEVDRVEAREVVIMGTLRGNVDASDKVFIKKGAQLIGDVHTSGIVIEDGAYFKGGIDIRKPAAVKAQAQ